MKKRMLSILIAVVLVIGALPGMAYAVSETSDFAMSHEIGAYDLQSTTHITRTTALKLESGKSDSNESKGWSWDAENKILRLDNVTIITDDLQALRMPSGTIVLTGKNTVTSTCYNEEGSTSFGNVHGGRETDGIFCSGSLSIEGDGDLTVSAGTARSSNYGIRSGGRLSIAIGGELTAKGGNSDGSSGGIRANFDITINSGTITAQAGTSSFFYADGISASSSDIIINGGTVVAKGGTANGLMSGSSYGLVSSRLIVKGGMLTAQCGSCVRENRESAIRSYSDNNPLTLGPGVSVIEPSEWSVESLCKGNSIKTAVIQGPGLSMPVPPQSPSISLSSVTINSHQVPTVVWNPAEGAANYSITIQDTKSGKYLFWDQLIPGSVNSFLLDYVDFVEENTYEIYVKAIDADGNESEKSNVITWTATKQNSANQQIDQVNVFQTQERSDSCTYAAATSLLRRRAIIEGINDWSSITETSVRSTARASGGGMLWSFTYKGMHVQCPGNLTDNGYRTTAQKKDFFIELLNEHPEGIIVYSRDKSTLSNGNRIAQHAILLTDYDASTDTFYCADSASVYAGVGRMELTESSIFRSSRNVPVNTYSQNDIIGAMDTVWYIDKSTAQKVLVSSAVKLHCPVEMVITINGEILDSRGVNGTISSRYASMSASGSGINRNVEVIVDTAFEDISVELFGTDFGYMTFIVEHQYSDGTIETQTLQNVSINATVLGFIDGIIPQSTVALSLKNSDNIQFYETWTAAPDETAANPSKGFETSPVTETAPVNPVSFSDISANAYYFDAVQWAVAQGITNGTSNNTFSPDSTCTRAQIVTFLWRAYNKPEPKSTVSPFNDVTDPSAYYYKAVLWAVENGVTDGKSPTVFDPNGTCTRGQAVTFLWRAADKPSASGGSAFTDVTDSNAYYYDAVRWAVEDHITDGKTSTTFAPGETCTRGQIVTFLFRDLAK